MKNNTTIIPKKIFGLLAIALTLTVFLIWFIQSKTIAVSWDFRNNLWGPAYLLVNHRSPYNIHVIFESSNAIWMPVIIGLFLPLGYFPMQWASNIWLLLNLFSLFFIVIIIANGFNHSVSWIVLTIFSLAIFPSFMSLILLGQVSSIICLALLLLSKYRLTLKPVIIGFLLAISFTKPQLIVLFLPTYLTLYFREQKLKKFLLVILYTFAWFIILCFPLVFSFPNWVPDFLYNLSINNHWFYPSLYSFLFSVSGFTWVNYALAGFYLMVGIGISLYLSFKLDHYESLLWCLAITPVFSPVVWSWDFILLFPLLVFTIFEKKSKISSWVIFSGYAICTMIFITMKLYGIVSDQLTVWVPLFLNVIFLISYKLRIP
jgi:hypothetical protein